MIINYEVIWNRKIMRNHIVYFLIERKRVVHTQYTWPNSNNDTDRLASLKQGKASRFSSATKIDFYSSVALQLYGFTTYAMHRKW